MKQEIRYDVAFKLTEKAKFIFEMEATSENDLAEKLYDMIADDLWEFIDFDYEREPYTEEELKEIKADQEYDRIHG